MARLASASALLHAALADPGDGERRVLVAFVQQALGCGCPAEIIRTAVLRPNARPLRDHLARQARLEGWEALARRANPNLGLPADTSWPAEPPWNWTEADLAARPEALRRLKALCAARVSLLMDVPGRALFCLVVGLERCAAPARLEAVHAAATLVKGLAGYNRVRLFTLAARRPSKPLPCLDTALTWEAVLANLTRSGAASAAAQLTKLLE